MASTKIDRNENTCSPRTIRKLLLRCMKAGRPVMVTGSPGVGKSDLVASLGAELGRPVIDMRLLLCDPTDIKGFPYYDPQTATMKWAPPSELPQEGPLSNAILFLDEINAAPPAVQASAYQLILNRRVGEYMLPKGVSIICAGNRDSDRGVTYRMASPLANRLVHLDMVVDFDDWQQWAIHNDVRADVVGFLTQHKHRLFDFDPAKSGKAFATPRTWKFASDLIDDDAPESLNLVMIAGTVGDGVATEFMAHRRVASKLPLPMDVLTGKVTTLDTKDIGAMYSLTVSLCYTLRDLIDRAKDDSDKVTREDWHTCANTFFTYMMNNLQHEMCVLGAKMAVREFGLPMSPSKMPAFTKFHTKYGKFIAEV